MYSLTDAAFHCKILGPNLIEDGYQLYTHALLPQLSITYHMRNASPDQKAFHMLCELG